MTVTKTARVAAAAAMAALVLTACGGGGTEPPGLDGQTDVVTSPPPTDLDEPPASGESTATPPPDDDGGSEPEPGFTQPYLPGDEPNVIELPDELPVEPPDDATDDELEVLEGVGRFMASWQAVLFGADAELSKVRDTAVEPQLGRLIEFIGQAEQEEWVFTGEPMLLQARDVSVNGDSAEVDLCLALPGWIEFRGGSVSPYPSPERYIVDMQQRSGTWVASNAREQDAQAC
ncbi:hypothetical protein G1H11_07440 [Phytoactinopolyspora alkaliphila]|uniref:Nuclear transport factor 2 family protein n=1 Tax=Phytoactinopolyspora alkaliphila TaxID=1783498 RepID=A0A6N9YJF8_9ACTN|nr:hypothetical protein [Phytoactinopolyspora alkaliphila]NED95146.1 hypothetical protein [Phytoactinopolyspora alkaliphila]